MIKNLKRLNSADVNLNRVQDNVDTVLSTLTSKVLIDGIRLTGRQLKAGQPNEFNHGLGRELLGWVLVRKRAQADVWDVQDANNNKTKTLILHTSVDVEVDLWVF